jgi:hypothetical protein
MFIRLFSRSPKDGISVHGGERAISIYLHFLSLTSQNYSESSLFWSFSFDLLPKSIPFAPPPRKPEKEKKDKEEIRKSVIWKYNALALTDWCLLRVFDADEALQLLYSRFCIFFLFFK